jgi:D-arabinose 5-phosphate isomerase GutQ
MSLLAEIALTSSTASSLAAFALTLLKITEHRRRRRPSQATKTSRQPRVRAGSR